ncbi:hypothetical protein Godav_029224 [Gossypium davidsonii]|uniref:Uncharacterized protein n=1 Tax=Gossypium davidsonii TaxID=34287 RepID=A0A7J8T9A0_GOSDV|nr:hypothetical protein [Gossypium davidsonii]
MEQLTLFVGLLRLTYQS